MDTLSINRYQQILQIFNAGITAADPYLAVKKVLLGDPGLDIFLSKKGRGSKIESGNPDKIHLIAFGKAAIPMLSAALDTIPGDNLSGSCIAVTNYENYSPLDHAHVIGAGHPLPDDAGLQAAKLVSQRVQSATSRERILVLISGGGSALLPLPVDGVSLFEKTIVTQLLLSSGATINQINCVRKHLSLLKGGGMAKLAYPALLHALILSDVVGDDISSIASGPTVPDPTFFSDAIQIINDYQLWDQIPVSVQIHLENGVRKRIAETPKPDEFIFQNTGHTLIGSNAISLQAVCESAVELGYCTHLYSDNLCGESRLVADNMAEHAKSLAADGLKTAIAVIAGGETTVTLTGNGKGGRNQEMALAFALAVERRGLNAGWVFLSGGTDGRDGPTDAAGGVVDADSLQRMRMAGVNPQQLLDSHDSYAALQAGGDLLITGATATNVADLQILLLYPINE
jgi:glycerate 2-kinase